MSDTAIIVTLACGLPLLFVVGGFIALMRTGRMRATRELLNTPTMSIVDLTDGNRVKVLGKAVPGDAGSLTSPASGRTALCYEISFRFLSGQTIRGPVPVHDCSAFCVEDDTGVIYVEASTARLLLDHDHQDKVPEDHAPQWLFDALERSGFHADPNNRVGRFEIEEGVIEPGETVAVVGTVKTDANGHRSLCATEDSELIVSDDPGLHGKIGAGPV